VISSSSSIHCYDLSHRAYILIDKEVGWEKKRVCVWTREWKRDVEKKERKYKPETECLSMKRHRDLLQGVPDIAIKTHLEGGWDWPGWDIPRT